jgi:hypothetical protein
MKCSHLAATACLAAMLGSAAVSAQAPPSMPPTTPPASAAAKAAELPMKPFWRLFEGQRSVPGVVLRSKLPPDSTKPDSARRFLCSTPVLPADAGLDRRIYLPPPGTKARFTIRTIQPVTCH